MPLILFCHAYESGEWFAVYRDTANISGPSLWAYDPDFSDGTLCPVVLKGVN